MNKIIISTASLLTLHCSAFADNAPAKPSDFGVTDTQYKVSETNSYIQKALKRAPVNHFAHQKDYVRVKTQQVIRENQDAVYSSAVVDVKGGVTISLPSYDSYSTIQIIDMQNYTVATLYPGDSLHITPKDLSFGEYVYLNCRTRPSDTAKNYDDVYKQQKGYKVEAASARPYTVPKEVISDEKLLEIRTALIKDVAQGKITDYSTLMGKPSEVDYQGHLYATAYGWGGLPIQDAAYFPLPLKTDGTVPSSITIDAPPVNYKKGGFWSITVYNKKGWIAADTAAVFSKDLTPNKDGSITIRFNAPNQPNSINTEKKFSAVLRMYMPKDQKEIKAYLKNAQKNYSITPINLKNSK